MRVASSSAIALTFVSAALLFTIAAAQGSASGDTCGNPCIVVSVGGNCSGTCFMCSPYGYCITPPSNGSSSSASDSSASDSGRSNGDKCGNTCSRHSDCSGHCYMCGLAGECRHPDVPSNSGSGSDGPDTCGGVKCSSHADCSGRCYMCGLGGECRAPDVPSPNSGSGSDGPDTCGGVKCSSHADCSGRCYMCGLGGECRHPDNAPGLKVSGSCNGECDCPEMCGGFCGECDAFTGRCVQPGTAKSPIRPVASSKAKKAALALLANGIDASSVLTCGHECDCPEMCSGFCSECDGFTARCVQRGTAKAPIKKLHKKQLKKLRP